MRKLFVAVCLLALFSTPATALEVSEGRLRLVLHESSGRFSLDYRADLDSSHYVPLLDSSDPRTSGLWIRDGNDIYRLGSSSRFELDVERRTGAARFIWTSSILRITQDFSFVTSENAKLANGVLTTVTIENVSERSREVEARYLFDTYLAESQQTHFITEAGSRVRAENEMTPSASNSWWASPDSERDSVGFQQLVSGEGITEADRVVFANWKRLSETTYGYTANNRRTFSLLPYSIDDSAAAVYYGPQELRPGETRTITTVVGNFDSDGYTDFSGARTETAELLDRASDEAPPELDRETVQRELVSVNDLIDEINTILEESDDFDREDVEVIEEILRRLKTRKEAYDTR
ncbi:MAG: hypothetical protein ACQETQ_04510 [Spirochaetota bacterium]